MHFRKAEMFRAGAAIAIVVLSGCGSSGNSPVHLVPSPRAQATSGPSTAFAVTVRSDNGASGSTPQVMNGSTVDVVVTGAQDATGGYVDAAGQRVKLTAAGAGTWRASLQYIDETNPPPKHPALDVGMEFPAGEASVRHIPILELHE